MPEQPQRQYELVCIVPPQLEGTDLEKLRKEIEGIITVSEGTINFKETKKHELAYPINKQGQGIYLISQVSILPEKIANISKELKLNKQVLRHLISQLPIVKPEIKKPRPKKIVKKLKVEKKPSYAKAAEGKTSLKEIDKKLEEIIKEI